MDDKWWDINNPYKNAGSTTKYSYASMMDDALQDTYSSYNQQENKMKKCEVNLPDGNGKAQIGENCFFICPATLGFMLFTNSGSGIEIYCFDTYDSLLKYMGDNKILDLTCNKVAENI